ncbi:hypothetical protein M0R72_06395 [Candidatus Pacearchaeota archaeon]|jgi:hypothetical protein|nr:hypothetical protein [Candidatus Pacearchaeota archaeon]
MRIKNLPSFRSYGEYASDNYGAHALQFTDGREITYYFSYKTLVAVCVPGVGLRVLKNYWGTTTGKHLNWIDGGQKSNRCTQEEFDRFLIQNGIVEEAAA